MTLAIVFSVHGQTRIRLKEIMHLFLASHEEQSELICDYDWSRRN